MRFNLGRIPQSAHLDSARLWLYLDDEASGTGFETRISGTSSSWSKGTLAWSNRSHLDTSVGTRVHDATQRYSIGTLGFSSAGGPVPRGHRE